MATHDTPTHDHPRDDELPDGFGANTNHVRGFGEGEPQPESDLPEPAQQHEARYGEGQTADDHRIPGPHSGKGPRGYSGRTDERIWEQVCERLQDHGLIDASEIDVAVEAGVVTLAGCVDSAATKRMAAQVAASASTRGDSVRDELRVHSPS